MSRNALPGLAFSIALLLAGSTYAAADLKGFNAAGPVAAAGVDQDEFSAPLGATGNGQAPISPMSQAFTAQDLSIRGDTITVRPIHEATGYWAFLSSLPEPADWVLMLIGFGVIGAALRGFVVTNRRLARLQAEESDEVS
jgi:hypothetical protein